MNIYYLGPSGTFSQKVAEATFPNDQKKSCSSFDEIVEFVLKDKHSIGLLAIENSITSSVHKTVDLLYQNNVCIVGEVIMEIQLHLIGRKDTRESEIRHVFSHPQALLQCSEYIRRNNLNQIPTTSTASAIQDIDETSAIIGSDILLRQNNTAVLKKNISNISSNLTRWIFISQSSQIQTPKNINKVTYIFTIPHTQGSLVSVLSQISSQHGNLTKIESRPMPGTSWEYGFWIDVEIPSNTHHEFDEMVKSATLTARCIGAYERGLLITQPV